MYRMVRITGRNRRQALAGQRLRRRAPRRLGGKRSQLKGFSAQQTRTLLSAIGRNDETKYYAKDLLVNQALDAAIHTPGTDMVPLVPPIVAGTGESQRVGRTVAPTKCRVDINVAFRQSNLGTENLPSESYANQIYVAMYVLRSKVYKNWNQFQASTQYLRLLDNGDSTSTSFGYQTGTPPVWTADARDLMKPIETSEFTLLRKRIVKLTKNSGLVDSGPSATMATAFTPNLQTTSYKGSFTYKLPKLQYDDTNTDMNGFPTNTAVFLAVGYTYADNNSFIWYAGGGPVAADDAITVSVRNHVWYKDS